MKVGDRVRIITKRHEPNQAAPHFGSLGTVIDTDTHKANNLILIKRDDRWRIWYTEKELELIGGEVMTPDFSLDEIHEAEKLLCQDR